MASAESPTGIFRVYRTNAFQRVFSLIFTGFAAFALVAIWYGILSGAREPIFWDMAVPVILVIAGVLFTFRAFRNSVYLSDNAIRFKSLVDDSVLPFDKIKGRRRYLDKGDADSPSIWHLVIEPNDDRYPKIDLQETYKFDDHFYRWFNALPDLDELDKHRLKTSNFGLV
jgi:hypothetical protein